MASTPLPPGWEAKYDYAQKRYFFIDHQTKVTTWVDPRLKQQQHPQSGVPQLSSDQRSARHSPKPTGQQGKPATGGWQHQVEDKYGMKVEIIKDDNDIDPEAASRILSRFPTVGKELIAMVSADCSSEEAVCVKLRDMGYREDKQSFSSTSAKTAGGGGGHATVSFGTKSPSHQEKLGAPSVGSKAPSGGLNLGLDLGARSADQSPSSKPHSRKASPERSAAPKNAALNNTSDRRSASPARPSKGGKGSGHKSHTAVGQTSAKASPLTELSTDKKKRLREKLEHEFPSQDKAVVESTLASCSYDEDKARFELKLLSVTKSMSETTNVTTTTVAHSIGVDGSEANQVNSMAAAAAAAAADTASSATDAHEYSAALADSSNSGEPPAYSSLLRQETRGPNASLAKGPNKHLLLSDYVMDVGSQSSNYHGPCKENYHGPCAELRKGHEQGIDKGPACLYSVSSE